jgi:exo-beta-1,3-glucanase (GH17 family)
MMRALKILGLSIFAAVVTATAQAQQPTPAMVVVPAAGTTATATPAPPPAPASASSDAAISSATKALEQIKAANDGVLRKQEAMFQQLDELQKAAEQLKVFSKRV